LQGEFLFPDDEKGTKKSVARDLAGLRPDTPLLSRNEMVSLKLTRYAFTPGLLVPTAQTALAFPAALRSNRRAQSLSSRLPRAYRHSCLASSLHEIAKHPSPALLDERQGLRKVKN